MKASAEKSSSTVSRTTASRPFFAKAGGGDFFAPVNRAAVPAVQAKMTVGKTGDKIQQKADEKLQKKENEQLQKAPAEEKLQKKEDDKIRKALAREEKRKSNDAAPSVSATMQSAIRSKTAGGQPLSADVRRDMESRFSGKEARPSDTVITEQKVDNYRQSFFSAPKEQKKKAASGISEPGQTKTTVGKTGSRKGNNQATQGKNSFGKKHTPAINRAGGGGSGAALPNQSAPSVPDAAGADPVQTLAAISSLPPVRLQAGLFGVSVAVGNTVNEERAELAANPPQVEHSPGSSISKKGEQAVFPKKGKVLKAVNKVPAKAAQPLSTPHPIDLPPAPLISTQSPAVHGDSEGKVSVGDVQALQASVRQMPDDDSGLYIKAEAPPLEFKGDADPQQAQEQQAELEKSLADAQAEGQRDIAQPMGEDVDLLGLKEKVTAEIGSGGAAGAGKGATPSAGGKNEEGISILAQQEHGQEIQAAVAQAREQMESRKQDHVLKVAEEKEKSDQELSAFQAKNNKQQETERTKAQAEVGKQRAEWTEEQTELLDTSRKEGNAAVAEGMQKVENEQTQAESKAAEHITKGNQDAEQARLKGEQEAAAEKQKAEEKSDGIFGWLADKAKAFFDGIKQAVKKAFEIARAVVKAAIDAAKKLAAAVIEAARKAIVAAIKAVGDALIAIGDKLLAAFPEMRDRFRNAIKSVVQKAEAAVNALAEQLQKGVQALLNLLGKGLDAALGLLEKGMLAAVDVVNNAVQGAIAAAKAVADAIGAFIALAKDIASGPGQWISNLGAAVVDGIRNHLWKAFKAAIKEWFNSKLEQVLGLGAMVWDLVKSGGLALAEIGKMAWEGLKAMIPVTLITILVEKLVSMIVPAAGAVKLILEGLQAAWGAVSRIIAAFGAFFNFLKAVKGGGAGPQFAVALAAAAIAVIDFVANWLLAKLAKGAAKVGGKIKGLAKKIMGRRKGRGLGGKAKGSKVTERPAKPRNGKQDFGKGKGKDKKKPLSRSEVRRRIMRALRRPAKSEDPTQAIAETKALASSLKLKYQPRLKKSRIKITILDQTPKDVEKDGDIDFNVALSPGTKGSRKVPIKVEDIGAVRKRFAHARKFKKFTKEEGFTRSEWISTFKKWQGKVRKESTLKKDISIGKSEKIIREQESRLHFKFISRATIVLRGAGEMQRAGSSHPTFQKRRFGVSIIQIFLMNRKIAGIPPASYNKRDIVVEVARKAELAGVIKKVGDTNTWLLPKNVHSSKFVTFEEGKFVLKAKYRGTAKIRPTFYKDSSSSRAAIKKSRLPNLLVPSNLKKFYSEGTPSEEKAQGYKISTLIKKAVVPTGDASPDHDPPIAQHWTDKGGNKTKQSTRENWNKDQSHYKIMSLKLNNKLGSRGQTFTEKVGDNFRGPNE